MIFLKPDDAHGREQEPGDGYNPEQHRVFVPGNLFHQKGLAGDDPVDAPQEEQYAEYEIPKARPHGQEKKGQGHEGFPFGRQPAPPGWG